MDGGPRLQEDIVGNTLNVLRGILWLLTLRTHHGRGYPGLELCVHHPGVRVCTTLVCFVVLGTKPGFCA